jgi:outer membrane protein TolC
MIAAGLLACALAQAAPAAPQAPEPLDLDTLVALARDRDPRVKVAQDQLDKLQGQAKEAYWAWFPKFETVIGVGGPTPEAKNDGLGGPVTPASLMYDANLGHVGFTVRAQINALLPIYTFGKITALRKAGEQAVVVGQALKARAQAETAQQVVEAYFGYQLARQGKGSLEEGLERITEAGKRIDALLQKESAQVSTLDQYKVQYFKQLIHARLAQAQNGMEVAQAALRLLVGAGPNSPLPLAVEELQPPGYEVKDTETYVGLALDHRPELRAANAGIVAREQQVLIREREYYPDFGILGFFNFAYTSSATRQRSPFVYDPYNELSSGVALVTRMTFDLPVKSAHVDQARAELSELQHQRELLASGIRLQVIKLRGDLVEAQQRAADYAAAEKSARRWATASYENFELGVGDTRELTDAFVALGQASGEKLKAWFDAEVGARALATAIGVDPRQVKQAFR